MTTITQNLPVLTITAEQIGPLGLTLDTAGDPGGHRTPDDLLLIPILDLGRCDERQSCRRAHDYLAAHDYATDYPQPAAADLPAFRACPSYRAGRCGGNGWQDPCLFDEPAASPGWQKVRRLVDSYAQMRADAPAWPAAKPHADLVAYAFDIEVDAAGAVLADRHIATTGAVLLDALTLAHHLAGGPLLAEEHCRAILARHFAAAASLAPQTTITPPAHTIYAALCRAALDGVLLAAAGAAQVELLLAEVAL